MFGKFTVEVNGKYIYHGTERVSNMIRILQYLLLFHGSIVSQSELIAECLGEETENEAVVLKNLIYRLRKIFLDHVGEELIVFKNGGYGMDDTVCDISLDAQEFVVAAKQMHEERANEELLRQACVLIMDKYTQGFLPKYSSLLWVMKQSVAYERTAIQASEILFKELNSEEDFFSFLPLFQKMCESCPYEESLYYHYIFSLQRVEKIGEAQVVYEKFSKLLFDELCVEPSPKMKELYQEILAVMQPSALPIDDVKKNVLTGDSMDGAFYCPQEVFVQLTHFSSRQSLRNGQSIMLMLCTLTEKDGDQPKNGERLRYMVDQLREAINEVCRLGDAYTRNSPSQFAVLLFGANNDNWEIVANRIRGNYYKRRGLSSTRLVCDCISAIDLDQVMR